MTDIRRVFPTNPCPRLSRRDLLGMTLATAVWGAARAAPSILLPELPAAPEAWLNAGPDPLARLAGRPVLVEFWTFGCVNCRNTLPWMKATHARYSPAGLAIVAVHTPEFPAEREPAAVAAAVRRLGVEYPVLLDPEARVWRAFDNEYWPATYLFDRQHRRVAMEIGELHAGEPRAVALEKRIGELTR